MIMSGKEVREKKLIELKDKISYLKDKIGLTVIEVGNDPASLVYVNQKKKLSNELGYNFNHIKLNDDVTMEEILKIIDNENNNDLVDGIIVQMPIPKHLDTKIIQNRIDPIKDVDGLSDINAGMLLHNRDSLTSCTPQGIMDMLDYYGIDVESKNVVIVGRSDLVGKPLYSLMLNKNATVTICHSKTKNLESITNMADILIVAIGKPNFIKYDYVKRDAVVIDVGINRLSDGKLVGDVDYNDVSYKTSYITPVPGGVGPMTVYELMNNTYKAHVLRKGLK